MQEHWEAFRIILTFDKWTGKNRRYLTINFHASNADVINLGMVRVRSSQKAELVTNRIKDFGLAMDNIVAFVTDGASVMMKLRRLAY